MSENTEPTTQPHPEPPPLHHPHTTAPLALTHPAEATITVEPNTTDIQPCIPIDLAGGDDGTTDDPASPVIPDTDATGTIPPPTAAEAKLVDEIKVLWGQQTSLKSTAKQSREALRKLRQDIGMRLHAYRAVQAHAGNADWWGTLQTQGGPQFCGRSRASCYRYLGAAERAANLNETGETAPATVAPVDPIEALIAKLLPRIRKVVTAPDAAALRLVQTIAIGLRLDVVVDGGGYSIYPPEVAE